MNPACVSTLAAREVGDGYEILTDPTEADGAGVGVRIGLGVGVRVGPGSQICEAGAILIVRVRVALLGSDVHVSASYDLICLHRGRGIGVFHRHGGRDKDLALGA